MTYGGIPKPVEIGASMVAVVGLFGVGQVAYGVLTNLQQDDWNSGARAVFLVLNAIVLALSVFVLVLGRQVRKGRMWAWITSLIVLPFAALFGGFNMLIITVSGSVPIAGTGIVLASLIGLLVLTVSRSARDHFLRRPAPPNPLHVGPIQPAAGQFPSQPAAGPFPTLPAGGQFPSQPPFQPAPGAARRVEG